MTANRIIALFLIVGTAGCSYRAEPSFEATVIEGGGGADVGSGDMPPSWVKSSEGAPYFPPVAVDNSEIPAEGSDSSPSLLGGVGASSIGRVKDSPYGIPVPGKNNLVRSPYSDQGFVDIAGHPPETEVKCPYTGKVFLVP